MKIQKRLKRTTKQYIIVAFICIVVIGGAAIFTSVIITSQIKEEYKALLNEAYHDIKINQKNVYVAISDITSGEAVTKENVEKRTVYSSQPEAGFITESELGKIALVNITSDTQVLATMLTENSISSELREMEYGVVNINSNIIDNDTVDVRIFYPNGEDYIILPKKIVKGITLDTHSCFLWLTEEEILRMSSAIVDAYLYTGAKIYTTKYIEPNLQEASLITYEPSVSTLLLIQDNPNIIKTATDEISKKVRKAMENRLAASMNTSVEEIDWELNPNELTKQEEAPTELSLEEKTTYQDEVKEKEAELDYGP
ncbi:MAG: hypothetical protein K0S01_1651 [Herbinix sp.]|jgi:hypothetical protein|nr:hypothetical protein [Herbinix sp.]